MGYRINCNIGEKMKYKIEFNTGVGYYTCDSIMEAMEFADDNASYTQKDIEIIDNETGEIEAVRRWWGVEADANEQEGIISFGRFGYYEPWEINLTPFN